MMKEELGSEINRLLDQVEAGQLSRHEFLRRAREAGAFEVGLGPLVRPRAAAKAARQTPVEDEIRRTGVIVRIVEVNEKTGNHIQGLVRPGAVPFWQRFTAGPYEQTITSGTAVVDLGDERLTLRRGESFTAKPSQPFRFVNEGRRPWRFRAHHPMWQPDTVFYEYEGRKLEGSELWFELKGSPDRPTRLPLFNIVNANGSGTIAITVVDRGQRSLVQRSRAGTDVVTVLVGPADLELITRRGPRRETLRRGQSQAVPRNEAFGISAAAEASMLEIRPDPPRFWHPDLTSYEVTPGRFRRGSTVWFEYALPV